MATVKETKRITEEEAKEQIIADLEKKGLGKEAFNVPAYRRA